MSNDANPNTAASAQTNDRNKEARLYPAIYSGSPAMAIGVRHTNIDNQSNSIDNSNSLASLLSSLGCELLQVTHDNETDIQHGRPETHRLTHIIYNKSYSADEMAATLGDSGAQAGQFHSGYDLNGLLSLGEVIWMQCDTAACLDESSYPNLGLFVELAQLEAGTLQLFREWATKQKNPCAPPPPSSPPAIPAPVASVQGTQTVSPSATSSFPSSTSFKVVSWNILSSDYAAPSTFFYCQPSHLLWKHRSSLVLDHLQRECGDVECLQETDYDRVQEGLFDSPDKESVYLRRPNHKRDGLLMRWSSNRFELQDIPQLITLEAKFAKHSTERRKDSMAWRVALTGGIQTTLQPRECKERPAPTAADGSTAAAAAAIPVPAPSKKAVEQQKHQKQRNLMMRQTHILTALDALERRLDGLAAQIFPTPPNNPLKLTLQRSISHEREEPKARSESLSPVRRTYTADGTNGNGNDGHNHLLHTATRNFHAIHFNDLSLLTRSKLNGTSNLFARFKKENIGLAVLLKEKTTQNLLLVVNVHLFWNPEFEDVKLSQAMYLLQHITELLRVIRLEREGQHVHLVLAGDFNSVPDSRVYQLLTQGLAQIHQEHFGGASYANVPTPIVSSTYHEVVFSNDATLALQEELVDIPVPEPSSSQQSSGPVKFLLDSTLLKIVKWLRAIGIDTVCLNSSSPVETEIASVVEEFFNCARKENRVIITQNKSLLKRRGLPGKYFLLPSHIKDALETFQLICTQFAITWDLSLFYQRCTTCNHLVRRLELTEYCTLPFLPEEYKKGFDDDQSPLYITQCTGLTCSRVRWWSSSKQRRTREKLFQVRLDLDVELTDDEGTNTAEFSNGNGDRKGSDGATEECDDEASSPSNAAKQSLSHAAASVVANPKTPSPAPTAPSAGNFTIPSESEVAAARAARKAAKAASKNARSAQSLLRRQQNAEKVNYKELFEKNSLLGDDGEYLFDQKPSLPTMIPGMIHESQLAELQQNLPKDHSQCHHHTQACQLHTQKVALAAQAALSLTRNQKAAAAALNGELLSDDGSSLVAAPPSLPTYVSSELWWTREKKQKMIDVERRIIGETRRSIVERRRKKKEQAELELQLVGSLNGGTLAPVPNWKPKQSKEFLSSPSPDGAPVSFASTLHSYWPGVIDRFQTPQGSTMHEHSLKLISAYAKPNEPELTNCTPKFMDTIDYLFHASSLTRVLLRPLLTQALVEQQNIIGCPTEQWPSDHEMLAATYTFNQHHHNHDHAHHNHVHVANYNSSSSSPSAAAK